MVVVSGGASHLLGPRFSILAVESNRISSHAFLHVPGGSWTRIDLHVHLGHADEEWDTSQNVPSAVKEQYLIQRLGIRAVHIWRRLTKQFKVLPWRVLVHTEERRGDSEQYELTIRTLELTSYANGFIYFFEYVFLSVLDRDIICG